MSDVHEHAHEATELPNKRIALLIAVLALLLAFAETGSKSTQTEALAANIEASNLWAFYQAKTIRETTLRTAVEERELDLAATADAERHAALDRRLGDWRKTIARYESEPSTGEGRKELGDRAHEAEHGRDTALARNHNFELSSAAFQIAIVLASASVITGIATLLWGAGALGAVGALFLALAFLAPHAVPLI